MVLIAPYRPATANPLQIQPTNISGSVGRQENRGVAATVSTSSSFTTVWDEDFSSGWETNIDWKFRESADEPPIVTASHPNFNGYTGIDVTYPEGADANIRWGGQIKLPNWPTGYASGRFTFDYMMHTPYSVPVNQKGVGVFASHGNATGGNCDGGWLCRVQWGDNTSATDDTDGPQAAHMYTYNNQGIRTNTFWGGSIGTPVFVHDVVGRVQLEWQINTAFDATDGFVRYKYDAGTASVHAEPTTTQAELTNFSMYCGSEANRPDAFVNEVSVSTFYGGEVNPAWEPNVDSKFTLGRMFVEVPA